MHGGQGGRTPKSSETYLPNMQILFMEDPQMTYGGIYSKKYLFANLCRNKLLPQGFILTKWHLHMSNTWTVVTDSGRGKKDPGEKQYVAKKNVCNIIMAICCKKARINDIMRHSFNMQDQKQLLVLYNLIPCQKIFSFHARKVRFLPK